MPAAFEEGASPSRWRKPRAGRIIFLTIEVDDHSKFGRARGRSTFLSLNTTRTAPGERPAGTIKREQYGAPSMRFAMGMSA